MVAMLATVLRFDEFRPVEICYRSGLEGLCQVSVLDQHKDASLEVYMLELMKPLLELVSYGLRLCPGLLPFRLPL